MDPVYNYYLDETLGGVSNDFTAITLGANNFLYNGGNVDISGRDKAIIIKMKESSSTMAEQWRVSYGSSTQNYCLDSMSLFGEDLLIVAGFYGPLSMTNCNGYTSSADEYLAIVKTSTGSIFKFK